MLNDRSRADDVLQETYLRFLQARLPAQIGEEHRKNYLFRIATNLLHDHRTEKIAQPLSDAPSRLDLAEEFRGRSDAATYLQQLTGKQRQLLWLAYVEEFTHKEIAAMLRLRTPSIRPMLARARQRLSEILKKEGFRAK
jgi:RNA polymerase sigma-70 factor (ECF subfamily)